MATDKFQKIIVHAVLELASTQALLVLSQPFNKIKYCINCSTSVQAGAVLMPLAMFLLSLKSIRVLSIMNFILKLAYLYKVTEKKRLIYMHLL